MAVRVAKIYGGSPVLNVLIYKMILENCRGLK